MPLLRMMYTLFLLYRQDDQALESVGERQAGGRLQPERGQRTAQGPQLHQYSPRPRPAPHGADG